mmetsp:Transcript_32822/g.75547  ORF Transcript_32822/g.75547 Transcript_32822/m.75547 type:complete len:277 (+) Transcript_32822:192-1022(+)
MKYRHLSKAGNHGDVLKHVLFVSILRELQSLHEDDEGLVILDTHAGIGQYEIALQQKQAFQTGVGLVLDSCRTTTSVPDQVLDYVGLVKGFDGDNNTDKSTLGLYPGSPAFTKLLLREKDTAVLCELNSSEFQKLESFIGRDPRFTLLNENGFASLASSRSPGLVLIDPPYEDEQDYLAAVSAVQSVLRQDPHQTIAIWYPLLGKDREEDKIKKDLLESGDRVVLATISDVQETGLTGSSLIILNPPKKFAETFQEAVDWLAAALGGTSACLRKEE